MQFLHLSFFLALAVAGMASPIQSKPRSTFSCYGNVAADQVDCLEACGDTTATDCTDACATAATQGYLACNRS